MPRRRPLTETGQKALRLETRDEWPYRLTGYPVLRYNKDMKREAHFRLTEPARALLAQLAQADGISQNAVLELLIREAARKRGIRADSGLQAEGQSKPASRN